MKVFLFLSPLLISIFRLESCTFFSLLSKSHTQAVTNSCLLEGQCFLGKKSCFSKAITFHSFMEPFHIDNESFNRKIDRVHIKVCFFLTWQFEKELIFHFNKMCIVWRGTVWFQEAMLYMWYLLSQGLRSIPLMFCCLLFLFCKTGLTNLPICLPDVCWK